MLSYEELIPAWREMIESLDLERKYRRPLKSAELFIFRKRNVAFIINNNAKRDWIKAHAIPIMRDKLKELIGESFVDLAVVDNDEMEILRILSQEDETAPNRQAVHYNNHPVEGCWFCAKPSETTILVEMKLDKRDFIRMVHKTGSSQIQIPICKDCKREFIQDKPSEPTSKVSIVVAILIPVLCIAMGELYFFFIYSYTGITLLGKILFGFLLGILIMLVLYWIISIVDRILDPKEVRKRDRFLARIEEYPEVKRLIQKDYDVWNVS